MEGIGDRYAQDTLYICMKFSTNISLTPSLKFGSTFLKS